MDAVTIYTQDVIDNISNKIHCAQSTYGFPPDRHQNAAKVFIESHEIHLPNSTSHLDIATWFGQLSEEHFVDSPYKWHVNPAEQDTGLLMVHRDGQPLKPQDDILQHTQVVGVIIHSNSMSYQDGFFSLCTLATRVFISQPGRLFLIGLYFRADQVEVLVFDRSGVSSCMTCDLNRDASRFLEIMLSFRFMADHELGKWTAIHTDDLRSFITLRTSEKLYLEDQTIAKSDDLVGAGTTCYRARYAHTSMWDHVAKFKWASATDRPEDELLVLAAERGVEGVVALQHYQAFDRISSLCQGLHDGPYRRLVQDTQFAESLGCDGLRDYTIISDEPYTDPVLTCVVTFPAGRPLKTFVDANELLVVIRDAVKAHRSLFQVGKILHRDISAFNIIIVDNRPRKGYLIDLDRAVDLTRETTSSDNVVGTRPFMSIGILKRRPHRYRHDLESFLYVLLWTVICNGADCPPETSRLRKWSRGTSDDIAAMKLYDMREDRFAVYLNEFPAELGIFKQVAEDMRALLFPLNHPFAPGQPWTGTNGSPEATNQLYDRFIDAFERAIEAQSNQIGGWISLDSSSQS